MMDKEIAGELLALKLETADKFIGLLPEDKRTIAAGLKKDILVLLKDVISEHLEEEKTPGKELKTIQVE